MISRVGVPAVIGLVGLASLVGSFTEIAKPGFSSLVLLSYVPLTLTIATSFLLVIILWFRAKSHLFAVSLLLAYSLILFNIWEIVLPNGPYFGHVVAAVSFSNRIISTGHATGNILADIFVSLYLMMSTSSILMGNNSGMMLSLLEAAQTFGLATFSYLIARRFTFSPKLAFSAAVLSLLGDSQLVKETPSEPSAFGYFFFLLCAYLVYRITLNRKGASDIICFSLVAAILTVTYQLSSIALAGAIVVSILFRRTKGVGYRPRFLGALSVITTILIVWITYVSQISIGVIGDVWHNLVIRLAGQQAVGSTSSNQGIAYYLVQLLTAKFYVLPAPIALLLPAWFIFLFAGGFFIWLFGRVKGLPVPEEGFIISPLAAAFGLFFLPGGAEWPRVLPYLGIFFSISFIIVLSRLSHKYHAIAVMTCIVLVTTLPTMVSYYSAVPFDVEYSWELGAGSFVSSYVTSGTSLVVGSGLDSFSYPLVLATSHLRVASEPLDEVTATLLGTLQGLVATRMGGEILSLSPEFFDYLSYVYGNRSGQLVHSELSGRLNGLNLLYSNGWTQLYS